MNVVWHGHYVKYLEIACYALLEKSAMVISKCVTAVTLGPVIDLQLRYIRPLRFGQTIGMRANLLEWETGPYSKTYEFAVINFLDWYSERMLHHLDHHPSQKTKLHAVSNGQLRWS